MYGQEQTTYGRLSLTGSVRYTKLDFREREQATDKTYNHASGRIGGTFKVVDGVSLYAAYATAFRGAFGLVVQRAPEPETSKNIEGGLRLALTKAYLAGTLAVANELAIVIASEHAANPKTVPCGITTVAGRRSSCDPHRGCVDVHYACAPARRSP